MQARVIQNIKKFSPPYGDGTFFIKHRSTLHQFSPPYGDGTQWIHGAEAETQFSPPYGDGTLNISQNIVKWKS